MPQLYHELGERRNATNACHAGDTLLEFSIRCAGLGRYNDRMAKTGDSVADAATGNRVVIDEYEGGYRPTATGKIGGRLFYFRWTEDSWSFGVSTEAAANGTFWWHSPGEHFAFETHGDRPAVWYSDSLPTLVEALRRYLSAQDTPLPEQDAIVQDASRQANAHFKRANRRRRNCDPNE